MKQQRIRFYAVCKNWQGIAFESYQGYCHKNIKHYAEIKNWIMSGNVIKIGKATYSKSIIDRLESILCDRKVTR
jgi:hypothetical protein